MKKVGIGILIVLVLAAGGFGLWRRSQQQAEQAQAQNVLRTTEVIRDDLEIAVAASGNVAVGEMQELSFSGSRTVAEVRVAVGERVAAGQELARLETADLERSVRQAEIAVAQAELNLEQLTEPADEDEIELARTAKQNAAQALEVARLGKQTAEADAQQTVVSAQRARENAFKDYQASGTEARRDTYEEALDQEAIARANAELTRQQAQDRWLAAYRNYQQAAQNLVQLQEGPDEEQVRQAELQVSQAELNLTQAQEQLEDAVLTAPFDGRVAEVNAQAGVKPPLTEPVFIVIDDAEFYIETSVDEINIGQVELGQPVAIDLDAYPDLTLGGEVTKIAPAPNEVGGIISYRLRVRITETKDADVRDGMTASVSILTDRLEDVLLLPNWAIRTQQASGETYAYCYCMQNGRPQQVEIVTGQRNAEYTEIISGLEAGRTVALVVEERNLLEQFGEGPPGGPPSRGQ